jgi:hypothetical protein
MQEPDYIKYPYLEFCEKCNDYVISLNGHCFNDDSHKTKVLTNQEFREAWCIKDPMANFGKY